MIPYYLVKVNIYSKKIHLQSARIAGGFDGPLCEILRIADLYVLFLRKSGLFSLRYLTNAPEYDIIIGCSDETWPGSSAG